MDVSPTPPPRACGSISIKIYIMPLQETMVSDQISTLVIVKRINTVKNRENRDGANSAKTIQKKKPFKI